jgi:hypothetical protein
MAPSSHPENIVRLLSLCSYTAVMHSISMSKCQTQPEHSRFTWEAA